MPRKTEKRTSHSTKSNLAGATQAEKDLEYYTTYRDDTQKWRRDRDRMRKFAAGDMHATSESEQLIEREQIDIVLNRIAPLLRTTVSIQTSNKPTGMIFGKNVNNASVAAVIQDYCTWHWEESDGMVLAEKTVMGQNREGVKFYSLFLDNNLDFGNGELRFGSLSYNNVFVDRSVGAIWDWSDAPRMIVSQLERPEDFFNQNIKGVPQDESLNFPYDEMRWSGRGYEKSKHEVGTPEAISNAEGSDDEGLWIRPMDIYERVWLDLPVIKQKETGKVLRILEEGDEITDDEKLFLVKDSSRIKDSDLEKLGLQGIDEEGKKLLVLQEAEARVKRIKYRKNISGKMIVPGSEVILPITDYPIIPVVDDDMDNAEPLGEVDKIYGANQLLNSCMSLVLLNAAGASNKKTLVDFARSGLEGDIEDFAEEFALPNSVIQMNMDPQTGKFPIQQFGPDPLNAAFFTLVQFFMQDIEMTGTTSRLRSGDPSQAPDTAFALERLGQWSEETTRSRVTRHELAIQRLWNICMQWGSNHYTFNKFRDIVQEEVDSKEDNEQNTVPLTELEVRQAWNALRETTSYKTKFRIRLGSTVRSETLAESQMLSQAAPGNPVLLKHLIKRMPGFRHSEKQEIISDIDIVAQLQDQLRQSQQAIKVFQGEIQRSRQQIEALEKRRILDEFEGDVKESATKVNNNTKTEQK